jgi:hypothetical protein
MIRRRNVVRRFGDFVAVDGLTMEIPAGAICAFLDRMAPASRLPLRMLAGLLPPTSGSIMVAGLDGCWPRPRRFWAHAGVEDRRVPAPAPRAGHSVWRVSGQGAGDSRPEARSVQAWSRWSAMAMAGGAVFRLGLAVLIPCEAIYAISVAWHGRKLNRSWAGETALY